MFIKYVPTSSLISDFAQFYESFFGFARRACMNAGSIITMPSDRRKFMVMWSKGRASAVELVRPAIASR